MTNSLKFERINIFKKNDGTSQQYYCLPVNDETTDIVDSLEFNRTYIPGIKRVITNHADARKVKTGPGPNDFKMKPESHTTIVEFFDGTRTMVKCSSVDTPDTELAIVNAIVKRAYGSINSKNETSADGCGLWLKKLVKSAWDQEKEDARIKAEKAKAKQEHAARQNAESSAARERRVKKIADELSLTIEALRSLGFDVKLSTPSDQALLNENCNCGSSCTCKENTYPKTSTSEYVRPNKKFSEFSTEEKREYWRNQKNKSKNK